MVTLFQLLWLNSPIECLDECMAMVAVNCVLLINYSEVLFFVFRGYFQLYIPGTESRYNVTIMKFGWLDQLQLKNICFLDAPFTRWLESRDIGFGWCWAIAHRSFFSFTLLAWMENDEAYYMFNCLTKDV